MGTVYEAFDNERQTRVALKALRNVDPLSIYRFKVEFRSLAELSHENLLPLYELFCEEGHWFFTMELLEGAADLLTYVRGRHGVERARDIAPASGSASGDAAGQLCGYESSVAGTEVMTSTATSVLTSDQTRAFTSVETSLDISAGDPPGADEASPLPSHGGPIATGPEVDYALVRKTFLAVARGVHALHASGKLHRDLKPENVMVRADGVPVLLDFGLIFDLKTKGQGAGDAARDRSGSAEGSDSLISGTIAYMAPEQATGSPLSNSSDWYAFGVMLFEALTGRMPFMGRGVEIIRARLTRDAPSVSRFARSVPSDLECLCSDLLHRDPAKRPTSARILQCLGAGDVSSPEETQARPVFIGRESYLTELRNSFAGLTDGRSELLCVHGRSGVGKTTLLQRFLAETVCSRGVILLEGRCYEQESVPYKAFDNLVDALAQFLIDVAAKDLSEILPPDTQALARIFPVLKRVKAIGDQAALGSYAVDPLLLRQQAFQALGRLLASIGNRWPLVLFIDDLQWGDIDSAQVLASILALEPCPRMQVILSYRSEYAQSPCLAEFRRAWEAGNMPHRDIEVVPLTEEESRQLALELLGASADSTQIDRIAEQARGSAFFVQELAESVRSGLAWTTPGTQSDSGTRTEDLDEVLWRRIQRLPEDARQLIEMVAVAGRPIQIGDLLHTRSLASFPQHAVKLLRAARLIRSGGSRLTDEIETFHDRVRESITKFLLAPAARDYHQQIADALEQNSDAAPETIASHLEIAESPRASHYYELAAERAMHVLAFDRAEEYLKSAERLATAAADRVRIEIRLVHFYTDTARFKDAYDTGCESAARLGFKLPRKFSPPVLLANMVMGLLRKGRRKPSEFLNLPNMTDERLAALVSLIAAMAKAAYQVRPEICVTICIIAVNHCLKHGNTRDAAIGYMVFGCIFLGGILGRTESGYEFGRLALALIDKFENDRQRAEVNFVVGYFGTSWLRPAVEAEQLWEIAFREGQRTGDLFHTGCAVAATVESLLMRGVPLQEVDLKIDEFWPVVEHANLREPLTCLASARRISRRLQAVCGDAGAAASEDDSDLLAELARFGSRHFAHFHFLNACMLHALRGDAASGLRAASVSAQYLPDSRGLLNTPEHYFWSAMLHAIGAGGGKKVRDAILSASRRFARWAKGCPANFATRHALLSAEAVRLSRNPDDALGHYRRAIEVGREFRTLHLIGLANRRASSLAAILGDHELARSFRDEANRAYREWGALSLVDDLAPSGVLQ